MHILMYIFYVHVIPPVVQVGQTLKRNAQVFSCRIKGHFYTWKRHFYSKIHKGVSTARIQEPQAPAAT